MTAQSVMQNLRAKRAELVRGRTQVFDIPGFDGMLAVELRVLDFDELKKVGKEVEASNHPQKELMAAAQQVIDATMHFWGQNPNSGNLEPLIDTDGDAINNWGHLATFLDLEKGVSARKAVIDTFNNDPALIDFSARMQRWMTGNMVDGTRTPGALHDIAKEQMGES